MNKMNSWGELDKIKGIEVEDSDHVKKSQLLGKGP